MYVAGVEGVDEGEEEVDECQDDQQHDGPLVDDVGGYFAVEERGGEEDGGFDHHDEDGEAEADVHSEVVAHVALADAVVYQLAVVV